MKSVSKEASSEEGGRGSGGSDGCSSRGWRAPGRCSGDTLPAAPLLLLLLPSLLLLLSTKTGLMPSHHCEYFARAATMSS
jgi:hypothetical protein